VTVEIFDLKDATIR